MKKFLVVTAMVLGLAGMSWAAPPISADATINLTITTAMTIGVTGSVDFGSLTYGTSGAQTVAPTSGAKFMVQGPPGGAFTVGLPSSVNLSNGTTTFAFTPDLGASSDGSTVDGTTPTDGGSYNLNSSGTDQGKYYFLLGGSVTLAGTETTGNYTGTYTLTVTY